RFVASRTFLPRATGGKNPAVPFRLILSWGPGSGTHGGLEPGNGFSESGNGPDVGRGLRRSHRHCHRAGWRQALRSDSRIISDELRDHGGSLGPHAFTGEACL